MKNIRKRHKRNILLIGLISILLIMMVGYSAFSSKLEIKESSMVTSKWDIEIV